MLSGMAHLLGQARQGAGMPNGPGQGSIEMLIAAGQFERVLKHTDFMMHLRMDSKVLMSYLSTPQVILRIIEVMCVDLSPQAQIERYYSGRPGSQAGIVCSTPIAQRIELADVAAEVFSQAMRGATFLEKFLAYRPAIALLFKLVGQDYSAQAGSSKQVITQVRPNPIVARYFIVVLNALMSTPLRMTALAAALRSPECDGCFASWLSLLENTGVAESLRSFLVYQDDFPQQCKTAIYGTVKEKNVIESLIDILICKNEVPSASVASNCAHVLTRVLSKNIHELIDIVLANLTSVANMFFSGGPSSSVQSSKGQQFTGLHLRKAGNVLVYAMSWMCFNSALRCQDTVGKLAAVARQQHNEKTHASVYDSDPIYARTPNIAKYVRLQDAHLRAVNINYYNTFFSVVSTIDKLQTKFSSYSTNAYMILEVVARLLGITADIKIAMHYKENGEPPANEFSGLDLNVFLMNDLNPLSYGYLSPTAQSGTGGPSKTKLTTTFIFTHSDGTNLYNPICPLEIAKRVCVNKIVEKVLRLMEEHPSMSALHFLGSRIILPLVEYGNLAPAIVQHVLVDSGLINKFNVLSQGAPHGSSQNAVVYKPIKMRSSWVSYLTMFALTFLRMAAGIVDEREYKSKFLTVAIRGKEETSKADSTYPRTLEQLEAYASHHPDMCDIALIKILFGSASLSRFSEAFLAQELLSPKRYNDDHMAFIGAALQSDQTNISIFRLGEVKDAMRTMKLTEKMIPRYNTLSLVQGPTGSAAQSQNSQLLMETRTKMHRNSMDIITGVGSFIKASSNEQQTSSLSDIINGFSDVSYTTKPAAPSAQQQCTTPVSYYNAAKHDFSEALQTLQQGKNVELAMQQQQQSQSQSQQRMPSRRRSLDQTDANRPAASSFQAQMVANLAQNSAQAQNIGADNKYGAAQSSRQTPSQSASAESVSTTTVGSFAVRADQYRGFSRDAPTRDSAQHNMLKSALENAKNAIEAGSNERHMPVIPETNARQDSMRLSERERINRERERLQKEREMLMHETNRPSSQAIPRDERLIKIMRDMDYDTGGRPGSPNAAFLTPPDAFNDPDPTLVSSTDRLPLYQERKKSHRDSLSSSRAPAGSNEGMSAASYGNKYSAAKRLGGSLSLGGDSVEKPSTPTLDSLLKKEPGNANTVPAVLLDPRFDGIRRRLEAMAEPKRAGSLSEHLLSKQRTGDGISSASAEPVQRRATVAGKVTSTSAGILSPSRDAALSSDRARKGPGNVHAMRIAIPTETTGTPTADTIAGNIRENLQGTTTADTGSASRAPLPTPFPVSDGSRGRFGVLTAPMAPASSSSTAVAAVGAAMAAANRRRGSTSGRGSIDATSVVSSIASNSRRGSLQGLSSVEAAAASDAARRPNPPPEADPSINFQVYSSGINSPHPMSMSVELRDALSGHGPSNHSPIKPTNAISSSASLRQIMRQRNKTNYLD